MKRVWCAMVNGVVAVLVASVLTSNVEAQQTQETGGSNASVPVNMVLVARLAAHQGARLDLSPAGSEFLAVRQSAAPAKAGKRKLPLVLIGLAAAAAGAAVMATTHGDYIYEGSHLVEGGSTPCLAISTVGNSTTSRNTGCTTQHVYVHTNSYKSGASLVAGGAGLILWGILR